MIQNRQGQIGPSLPSCEPWSLARSALCFLLFSAALLTLFFAVVSSCALLLLYFSCPFAAYCGLFLLCFDYSALPPSLHRPGAAHYSMHSWQHDGMSTHSIFLSEAILDKLANS